MCDLNKPLFQCTLGDFVEAVTQVLQNAPAQKKQTNDYTNMPKGLAGIREIFGCSDYTARKILSSGVIEKAIFRLGARTFVTDPAKALELYTKNNS